MLLYLDAIIKRCTIVKKRVTHCLWGLSSVVAYFSSFIALRGQANNAHPQRKLGWLLLSVFPYVILKFSLYQCYKTPESFCTCSHDYSCVSLRLWYTTDPYRFHWAHSKTKPSAATQPWWQVSNSAFTFALVGEVAQVSTAFHSFSKAYGGWES